MLINYACIFMSVDTIKFYPRTIQILIINKIQRILGLIKTTDINSRRIKIKISQFKGNKSHVKKCMLTSQNILCSFPIR
jgi:hypothetical protein